VYDCEDVDIRSENVGISLSTTKINANTTIETSEEFISSVIDGYNFV
jgi:hypothetical protein